MATGGTASPHVEPVFLRKKDLPLQDQSYDTLDLCVAAERVCGGDSIYGAQAIRGLYRIYPNSREARNKLLIEGVTVRGIAVTLHDKNPFILRDSGQEVPATKLFISDFPVSCSNRDIEGALVRVGCVLRSSLLMERMRDRDGKLTKYVTGRRFCFINLPTRSLEPTLKIGSQTARLYYREQDKPQKKPPVCSNCLLTGHHRSVCANQVTCRECHQPGHKRGDSFCPALLQLFQEKETSQPGLGLGLGLQDAAETLNPMTETASSFDKTEKIDSKEESESGDRDVFFDGMSDFGDSQDPKVLGSQSNGGRMSSQATSDNVIAGQDTTSAIEQQVGAQLARARDKTKKKTSTKQDPKQRTIPFTQRSRSATPSGKRVREGSGDSPDTQAAQAEKHVRLAATASQRDTGNKGSDSRDPVSSGT